MRNKRVIIIFSIILFFALIVVLSSILFKIDSDSIIVSYATDPVLNIDKGEVDGCLSQYAGTSIFFLNEKKISNKLETEIANLKVISIERKFPQKVYITVQERIEVYCFKIDEKYVYTDYNCKVLRIEENKQEIYESKYGQVIDIEIENKNLISSYQIGEILEFYNYGATKFLAELYLNTTNNPIFFRKYIKSIELDNVFVSDSIVKLKMETGAEFTFVHTMNYYEKCILYMNKLMKNDYVNKLIENGQLAGVEIDRITGKYGINFNLTKPLYGAPFY